MAAKWTAVAEGIKGYAPFLNMALTSDGPARAEQSAAMLAATLGCAPDELESKVKDIGNACKIAALESFLAVNLPVDPETQQAREQLRQMEELHRDSITKTTKIAWTVAVGFLAILLGLIVLAAIPGTPKILMDNGPLGLLLGGLISAFTAVIQYYFGSSSGSALKSTMLGNAQQKP